MKGGTLRQTGGDARRRIFLLTFWSLILIHRYYSRQNKTSSLIDFPVYIDVPPNSITQNCRHELCRLSSKFNSFRIVLGQWIRFVACRTGHNFCNLNTTRNDENFSATMVFSKDVEHKPSENYGVHFLRLSLLFMPVRQTIFFKLFCIHCIYTTHTSLGKNSKSIKRPNFFHPFFLPFPD